MKDTFYGDTRSHRIGFAAIVMACLAGTVTTAMAAKGGVLGDQLVPEEMLFVRSACVAAAAYAIALGKVYPVNWKIFWAGLLLGLSSICFFRALQAWRVNPVVVMLTLVPAVNIAISFLDGHKPSKTVILSAACLILGCAISVAPSNGSFSLSGLAWSIACILTSAWGFDLWGKCPESTTVSEKCFWYGVSATILAGISVYSLGLPLSPIKFAAIPAVTLLLFCGMSVLYMYASIIPFDKLGKMDTARASTLLYSSTPISILGAWLINHEEMALWRLPGVALATLGAIWLTKETLGKNFTHLAVKAT
ncbi:MAG: hypothetical protein WCV82_00160 [Candidatus Paceibacterota bacterium]